jgi:hypothetical protein
MMLRRLLPLFSLLLLLALWPSQGWCDRLYTNGFEQNNTGTLTLGGTSPTVVTSPHSGTYGLATSAAAGTSDARVVFAANKTSGTLFYRFYFKADDATPSADTVISYNSSNTNVTGMVITLLTSGVLKLANTVTATEQTMTTVLSNGTWYRVESQHVLSDTVGEVRLRLYSNAGTLLEEVSITGEDTLPVGILNNRIGKNASISTFTYDDFGINDETTSFQATWLGPGNIYMLVPDSDVANAWEDETAGASTYVNIDEFPAALDTADYNTEIVNLNSIDQFGLTNPGAEVPANATITLLAVYATAGSTQTSATNMRFKVWNEVPTLTNGGSVNVNINGFAYYTGMHYDTTGKTKANLDSFNVGYENITDVATRERRVAALWVNVEWVEAPAGASLGSSALGWMEVDE